MIVPVQVGPDGGVGIKILAAVHIVQHRAGAVRDDNRLARQPVLHLRERMPDVAVIEFGQLMHAGDLAQRRGGAERNSSRSADRRVRVFMRS